jgi:hypothetical protein
VTSASDAKSHPLKAARDAQINLRMTATKTFYASFTRNNKKYLIRMPARP